MKEKKNPVILESLFSLSFFYFSSSVTRVFSSPIKEEVGRPTLGDQNTRARHEHTAERQSSSQHPFTTSTRDLGSFRSRLFVTPTVNQVLVTRAAANWM